MPVLDKRSARERVDDSSKRIRPPAFLSVCANPRCASGWLHVWRSRTAPIVEGGWTCSSGCTRARMAELLRREREGRNQTVAAHRHRIPLGLVLLSEGWISHQQLKKALDEQRAGAAGRIGALLIEHCALEERRVTQALSIQWNCPIFAVDRARLRVAVSAVPRLFIDTFRFFPLRLSTAGILYIAFEDRIDHAVILALERMTGFRVEAGLVNGSDFERGHAAILDGRFAPARIIEASSVDAVLNALTSLIEKEKPVEARLVRIHDFYWLRLWKELPRSETLAASAAADGIQDVICSLTAFQ